MCPFQSLASVIDTCVERPCDSVLESDLFVCNAIRNEECSKALSCVCVCARPRHFHRLPAASQDVVSSVTNRIAAAECLFFPRVLAARLRVGKTDRRTVYVSRRSVHLYPRCRRRRRLRQGSTSFVATDTVKPAWRGSSSPPPSHRRVCPSNAVVMLLVESPGTSNVCSSITRRRRRRRLRRLLPHFRSATNGSILHAIPRRPVTVSAQSKVLGVARLHLPTAFLL